MNFHKRLEDYMYDIFFFMFSFKNKLPLTLKVSVGQPPMTVRILGARSLAGLIAAPAFNPKLN